MVHRLFGRRNVEGIFTFRELKLRKLFGVMFSGWESLSPVSIRNSRRRFRVAQDENLVYDSSMPLPCNMKYIAHSSLCAMVFIPQLATSAETNPPPPTCRYEIRVEHDPHGIGKFYLGREIAHVVGGHETVGWLERPEREREERPDLLVQALRLRAGDAVADIGAGTGYYTRRLAKVVGTNGVVYAVEIQKEMLEILADRLAGDSIFNVKTVLGTASDPKLARASVDLILMVDVYHEFEHPFEMVEAMCRALKPGGRMVFVEFRAEDPDVPIKPVHKMTEAQVRKEMRVHPLEWVETIGTLPWQHIIVFRKRE